jgi:ribosomal protein S18 acetylase RimI-like enzyme
MPRLSNFFRSRDPVISTDLVYRRVERQEIESALRLILVSDEGLASDQAVLDFLSFAMQRKIDLSEIWIALMGNRIAWALLPISSPGRTMLLFTPNRLPRATPIHAVRQLTDRVCEHWKLHDMHLAQFLLDPAEKEIQRLYAGCGFETLAELLYLSRTVRGEVPAVSLPDGFTLTTYSRPAHEAFASTIQQSYEGSLDCPALNGKRHIDDVIAGHKAAGAFEPSLWYLLSEQGAARGVLILSPSNYTDAIELVYLGLVPAGRRRGLGDVLMRLALEAVTLQHRTELSLAVDSRNLPAMRLYYRHGLKRVGSRLAMVRDLRSLSTPDLQPAGA